MIGLPHPSGRAAMKMLEKEGFAYEGYVDIFDGGPTMTARTDQVKSVAAAHPHAVERCDLDYGERAILATGELEGFRAAYGMREITPEGTLAIDEAAAAALQVSPGAFSA